MLAKTQVVYSMCSLLTYILCTLCVFSGYIYFNMPNKKLPYHTIPYHTGKYHGCRLAEVNICNAILAILRKSVYVTDYKIALTC